MCKIEFKVGNAAFRLNTETDENGNAPLDTWAVADAIRHIAFEIENGETSGMIMDANGNTVGKFVVED